jgi:hypothetical protein
MAFSGLSTNRLFTPNLIGEDISEVIATLAPYEAPFLDWLGDSDRFAAMSPKHEFIEDFLRPRYITASTAIASATAVGGFQVTPTAEALTVGTILENESAAPELMQVVSIPAGGNSVVVARNFDGSGSGSLAAGGQLFVRWPTAEEGHDHDGLHTARPGNRRANTVGYFSIEVAASGTELAVGALGADSFENARAKIFREIPGLLESEVLRGVWNGSNSLGTTTKTTGGRTMQGIRTQLTSVSSTVTASSFAANPHLYIGNVWEQAYVNGASADETWGIVAGRTFFRNISDMNDTKVQDSNEREKFKRVIRKYEGPFGECTVFLSRALPATELLIVPRERLEVVPLQGRSFAYQEMGVTGDNRKGMVVGEYTLELHHQSAMARLRV